MTVPVLPTRGRPIEVEPGWASASVIRFEGHTQATEPRMLAAISSLLETLEILADPGMVQAIAEGDEAVKNGDVVSLEEFRQALDNLRGQQRG